MPPTDPEDGKTEPLAIQTPEPEREWKKVFESVGAAKLTHRSDRHARRKLTGLIEFRIIDEERSSTGYLEILAFDGKERIGYAYLESRDGGELNLAMILTLGQHDGQGVGRALVAEVEKYGREHGFSRITGEVNLNDHTPSVRDIETRAGWFKMLGFSVTDNGAERLIVKTLK